MYRWMAVSAAPLLLSAICLLSATEASPAVGFIRTHELGFVDEECNQFNIQGLNTWQLLEVAAGKLRTKPVHLAHGTTDVVQWTFATAAAHHLNTVRAFAHGTDSSFPLQTDAGRYSEHAFQALDYMLDEASKYGIRLLLSLGNNWDNADSKSQYVKWAGAKGPDAFFTDKKARQLFKDHINVVVNRRNSINQRLYKEDPTILAWDLLNEPRCDCFPISIPPPDDDISCRPECAMKLQGWIEDVSVYLKKADPNHMVTVGGEGFYGPKSRKASTINPGNGWASITGQDFESNYASKSIDFAVAHVWSDNWETWDLDFVESWIKEHAADAAALGKPFLIEEFGKEVHLETPTGQANTSSLRSPFYRRAYQQVKDSLADDGALRGIIFWQWSFAPYVDDSLMEGCAHCKAIQVSAGDSVFTNIIAPTAEQAAKVAARNSPVHGCKPGSPGSSSTSASSFGSGAFSLFKGRQSSPALSGASRSSRTMYEPQHHHATHASDRQQAAPDSSQTD